MRFQGSAFDGFSRRRLIENRDTILELTAKIQELQNEVHCMNGSNDFKDAESVRSGLSHVPSQPALLPIYRDPGGLLRYIGKRFCKSTSVFFVTLSRRIQSLDF